MDNIIEARELQIERKHFYVELRENDRGKFLRITEEAHGRRNSIIVSTTGVDDFTAAVAEDLTNNERAPAWIRPRTTGRRSAAAPPSLSSQRSLFIRFFCAPLLTPRPPA